ncbi:hypothetical protein MMC13_003540 [Lambiella insularis]|nr:hypothetical protein [Lambiella insularis]
MGQCFSTPSGRKVKSFVEDEPTFKGERSVYSGRSDPIFKPEPIVKGEPSVYSGRSDPIFKPEPIVKVEPVVNVEPVSQFDGRDLHTFSEGQFQITKLLSQLNLAPAPTTAPICFECGNPGRRFITSQANQKGNAGRPYYKCVADGRFLCFADQRGNDPTNPPCDCGESSKRQISGSNKSVPRQVHYVCRLGGCDFYQAGGVTIPERLVEPMARHYII